MSKTLRTLSQLQDALDAERVWRLKELSILRKKLLLGIGKIGVAREDDLSLLRPCITMLYAHWEGFVKAACGAYLEFVALQRLANKEMLSPFLALAARRHVSQSDVTGAEADRLMASFYREHGDRRDYIPYKNGVDTKSNLWFDVFRDIYESLGLSWQGYELKRMLIDTKLVSKRNAIAHGRFIDVKSDDVEELFDNIIELMDKIKEQLLDSAQNGKYKLPNH
ncbi:MAE_28990/MAE_18760 family HEPN-like nuclease [Nitrosospira sp. Is2]|uniref:MAE_28990/MAE_18760 family HEPN-like nuclease n=1 Tax=Nitrosospira sp. Is2 TaxID=3080532 RepID=UPI002952D025|nr:MAE_28990/MAE_18760 family HEPN-like nuclease [Nitrosospira sp. Is2]WON73497.1 MAE_28990/MAE_18760 family HEPN-like nuclease [Nitrosospira sp. Is2]